VGLGPKDMSPRDALLNDEELGDRQASTRSPEPSWVCAFRVYGLGFRACEMPRPDLSPKMCFWVRIFATDGAGVGYPGHTDGAGVGHPGYVNMQNITRRSSRLGNPKP
jgi:hypothetical protein